MSGGKLGLLGPIAAFALKYPRTASAAVSTASSVRTASTAFATAVTAAGRTAADSTPVTFLLAHWKAICIILAVVCACVSAFIYVEHVKRASFAAGVTSGGAQAAKALTKANQVAKDDQSKLDLLKLKYDDLAKARQIQVVTVTQPHIERIVREVQSAPVYRSCTLTDSVFDELQAEAAAVNASVAPSSN